MVHKFDPAKWERLHSPERRAALPPEQVLDEIRLAPGQTMVDVGAGTGFFAIPAARRVGPRGKVYAVDISRDMLQLLAAQIEDEPLPIVLVQSQETSIPLDDAIADHVFAAAVFHEIAPEDRPAFLGEMIRLMKPDGMLTILDWAPVEVNVLGPPPGERVPPSEVEAALLETRKLQIQRSSLLGEHFYLVQASRLPAGPERSVD